MKILILGHDGMLGHMVNLYFKSKNYDIITTDLRWPNEDFKLLISTQKVDCIINCIGIIPQRKPDDSSYYSINCELPIWLDSLGIKIIHPDTDENDETSYGSSKKIARDNIHKNTKIIKTSIIGFEKNNKFSFLEWFLNSEGTINGYTNLYWNGNTTLEWSKWAEKIISNWLDFNYITTISNPDCLSKYDILLKMKNIFKKDIEIIPTKLKTTKNNCMIGIITDNLFNQIQEMKNFYKKRDSK